MNFTEVKLPSNRKFGFFFSFVFALAAAYFHNVESDSWAYIGNASSVISTL